MVHYCHTLFSDAVSGDSCPGLDFRRIPTLLIEDLSLSSNVAGNWCDGLKSNNLLTWRSA